MNKNIYMSKGEQSVYNSISSTNIDTSRGITDLLPNSKSQKINKLTSSLSSKGYLYRIKKGTYLIQKTPSDKPVINDPYSVALAIHKGYIGFLSALRIYDLIDYEPFTIFVVTPNRSAEKKIGEYTFKYIAMGKKAFGMTYHKNVYVSTVAKTFFDCFYKPQYAGGYSTIMQALDEASIDWNEFKSYLYLGSDSFCQRTGYVLDMLNNETNRVPADILDYLKKRIKNNTVLLPSGRRNGKYAKEWKVLDNLGKENILSWYYHG